VAERPASRAAAGSGRRRQEQTHPGTPWAAQSKPTEPQDTLQVRETHLDLLALTQALGSSERPGNVPGACSWMSRGILREGSFGQHCSLSGHTSQSSLLARYRSVLPSCTVPLVPSCFPPGQGRRRWSDQIESRRARRCHHFASTCRTQGYVARCPSSRLASSSSELRRKQYRLQAAPA
jgi:hypothetical protein